MKKFFACFVLMLGTIYPTYRTLSPVQVFFSPRQGANKKIGEEIIEVIDKCRLKFYGAIYMFTDKNIATALINAKKRGADVALIADKGSIDSRYGQIARLKKAGIPVYLYLTKAPLKNGWGGPLMHNKFFVCDQPPLAPGYGYTWLVGTGSFNWTYAASNVNCENFLLIRDEATVGAFLAEFASLKTRSTLNFSCNPDQERLAEIQPVLKKPLTKRTKRPKAPRRSIEFSFPPLHTTTVDYSSDLSFFKSSWISAGNADAYE